MNLLGLRAAGKMSSPWEAHGGRPHLLSWLILPKSGRFLSPYKGHSCCSKWPEKMGEEVHGLMKSFIAQEKGRALVLK